MHKSECRTQEWTLAGVPVGRAVSVTAIIPESPGGLLVHGIHQGSTLVVEADAPFGGPRIVCIGRARVAVDRRLAAAVRVAAGEDPGAGQTR